MSAAPNTTANGAVAEARDPSGFLSEIIGAPVTVKLNSGVVYKGKDDPFLSNLLLLSASPVCYTRISRVARDAERKAVRVMKSMS